VFSSRVCARIANISVTHDCALERAVLKHRLAGLMEQRNPRQKPSLRTPTLQAKILAAIKEVPKRWHDTLVVSKNGERFRVSKDTVQRILAQAAVRPASTRTWPGTIRISRPRLPT
jgi:hypothetical protein